MLIVDLHALHPIDVLNLIDQVVCQCFNTQNFQDVVRHRITLQQHVTTLDIVAFLNRHVTALWHHVFHWLQCLVVWTNDNTTLALVVATEFNATVDTSDNRMILWTARFKQLRNSWQTTGNIAGLRSLFRDTRHNVTCMNFITMCNRQNRIG